MKSYNYVIYLKKRMDMGKCTSCILYIKQNPTTYKETTSFAFLLESSTTNQSIPNNIIYSPHPPPFPKKKRRKKMVINRVLDLICHVLLCLFFESFAKITVFLLKLVFFYSYLKLPLNRPLDTKWIGHA